MICWKLSGFVSDKMKTFFACQKRRGNIYALLWRKGGRGSREESDRSGQQEEKPLPFKEGWGGIRRVAARCRCSTFSLATTPAQFQVNSSPNCLDHAGGMIDLKLLKRRGFISSFRRDQLLNSRHRYRNRIQDGIAGQRIKTLRVGQVINRNPGFFAGYRQADACATMAETMRN